MLAGGDERQRGKSALCYSCTRGDRPSLFFLPLFLPPLLSALSFPPARRISVQLSTFTPCLSPSLSRSDGRLFLAPTLPPALGAILSLGPGEPFSLRWVVQSRRSPPPLSLPYHRFRATNSLGFCLLAPFSLPAGTHPCALPASSDPHGHDREPRPNESRRLSASQPSDSPPRHATPRAACVFEFVFEQPVK